MAILAMWKEEGETPLEALKRLREKKLDLSDTKMTYAGRLDPLAEGVMLVLTAEDVFKKEKYLNLSKEYQVEVLFGVGTDTGDVLGLVKEVKSLSIDIEKVRNNLSKFVGKFIQEYPQFSAPKIDGHTNFSKEVEIFKLEMLNDGKIDREVLIKEIIAKITKVGGDFRQREILDRWRENNTALAEKLVIVSILAQCSSGTYMRSLAENIGKSVGLSALAFKIKRTRVGDFSQKDCLTL